MNEKRQHLRTQCRVPACIEQAGFLSDRQHCYTSDVGMKGIFLRNAPGHPVGSKCTVVIHDKTEPLKLDARVTHVNSEGLGLTFTDTHMNECLRLKHLVKPSWNGESLLDGFLMACRYIRPRSLGDSLSLTSLLSSRPANLNKPQRHTCDL